MDKTQTMNCVELAKSYQQKNFNCAQSTFVGCSRYFKMDQELALKVSGMFGAGICRTGETCGAVIGALMALGLKYSMVTAGDVQTKSKSYQIGREFMARFKTRNGCTACRELLNCEIGTPEGDAYAKANNLHDELCPKFIQDAVEIFYGMIDEA